MSAADRLVRFTLRMQSRMPMVARTLARGSPARPLPAFALRAMGNAVSMPHSDRSHLGNNEGVPVHTAPHFRKPKVVDASVTKNTSEDYMLSHAVYSQEEVNAVEQTHLEPETSRDRAALAALRVVRRSFDWATGYGHNMNVEKYLTRIVFLETVAGVPGMVGAMIRHTTSLRSMRRDYGWIHTLLEEAENERMHLLTFLEMQRPGPFMRFMVLLTQGVFFNSYFIMYLLAPRTCHRFVGYLEEEAVKTYTRILEDMDSGKLPEWADKPAPKIAKKYWRLDDKASMRDLILAVRADEAIHRDVNHVFATLPTGQPNPFK